MKFYSDKLKRYRTDKSLSAEKLAELLDISRTTLWKWEKGLSVPREAEVRMLCNMLEISVDRISDLKAGKNKSQIELSDFIESWLSLTDFDSQGEMQKRMNDALRTISTLNRELNKASVIIKSLLMSIDTMFYIKDKSLKFITANAAFLENCGLDYTYKVFGSKDSDYFNIEEAKKNMKEDSLVLVNGKKIVKEGFIPGTKKKKWGLITKSPTSDATGAVTGVLSTIIDLTEKKKQEKIRELIELNLNSMSAGFSLFDISSGKYLYLNKERENIFGYSNKIFYEKGLDFLTETCIHPDFREKMKKLRHSNVFSGTTEYKIISADGTEKWIQDYESRIEYFNKICGISVMTDVTDKYKDADIELNIPRQLKECINFHGHFCPGLTTGYVVAMEVLNRFNLKRAQDEEIVMISECDSCSIDAFQIMLGTTAGKGNLIVKNFGKNVFTVYLRNSKKALQFKKKANYTYTGKCKNEYIILCNKVSNKTATKEETQRLKELKSFDMVTKDISELFDINEVKIPEPDLAEVADSITCSECGAAVMSTKTVTHNGKKLCISCAKKLLK